MAAFPTDATKTLVRLPAFPGSAVALADPSESFSGAAQVLHVRECRHVNASASLTATRIVPDACTVTRTNAGYAPWENLIDAAYQVDALAKYLDNGVKFLHFLGDPGPRLLDALQSSGARSLQILASALYDWHGPSALSNAIAAVHRQNDIPDDDALQFVLDRYDHLLATFRAAADAVPWGDVWFELEGDPAPDRAVAVAAARHAVSQFRQDGSEESTLAAITLACAPILAARDAGTGPSEPHVVLVVPERSIPHMIVPIRSGVVDMTPAAADVALATWMNSPELSFYDAARAASAATA